MESCVSSFSERSRPCTNSFRASSEEVVMGIFPPLLLAAPAAGALPSSTLAQLLRATTEAITIDKKGIRDLLRCIECVFSLGDIGLKNACEVSPVCAIRGDGGSLEHSMLQLTNAGNKLQQDKEPFYRKQKESSSHLQIQFACE